MEHIDLYFYVLAFDALQFYKAPLAAQSLSLTLC